MKNTLIYIMFIVLGCCGVYIWANEIRKANSSPAQTTTTTVKRIMSIRELQQALNAQGHSRYSCEVDGCWGPETAKALENYCNDRNYKESTYE